MKKTMILGLCLLLLTSFVSAAGQEESAGSETPHIVIYNNSGAMNAGIDSTEEMYDAIQQYILDGTGVMVDVIKPPPGEAEQKLNVLLAGGEQVDAFWGNWEKYSSKRVIVPINDLMDKYGMDIMAKWPQGSIDACTDTQGSMWGIPRVTPTAGCGPWIRADLVEELGVKFPETIDEIETYLAAVKAANPDGEGSIIMLAEMEGKHGSAGIFSAYVGGFTKYGYTNWVDSDNMLKPAELQPGFIDFVAKMKKWYDAGYIYPEFASLDRPTIRGLVSTGKVAAATTWYSNVANVHYDMNKINPDAEFMTIEFGVEGPMGKGETAIPPTTQSMLISANSKNPEAVVKVMNFLYDADGTNFAVSQWGPEGINWNWVDQANGVIELTTGERTGYGRDFDFAVGLPAAALAGADSEKGYKENQVWGLAGQGETPPIGLDFSRTKWPVDAGVVYDPTIIDAEVPGYGDISRMRAEEVTRFIIGERPLSEWDSFIDELYDAGLDAWIETHTRIYNEQN